jgi:hypothetical protein
MPDRASLAALLADPTRAAAVPLDEVPALLDSLGTQEARLGTLRSILAARLALATAETNGGGGDGDRLLTADEAAERLGVTKDWLRRNRDLPFVYKLSEGVVRYSLQEMERWKRARRAC